MPGTVGDSKGTIHDGQGGPSFNPDDVVVPGERANQSNQQDEDTNSSEADTTTQETQTKSKRMKYAEKYGDTWPEDRKRRFLHEHDVSAREMGWQLTE
jgi:hypothetical protein